MRLLAQRAWTAAPRTDHPEGGTNAPRPYNAGEIL
jgi:hypothetical protein